MNESSLQSNLVKRKATDQNEVVVTRLASLLISNSYAKSISLFNLTHFIPLPLAKN